MFDNHTIAYVLQKDFKFSTLAKALTETGLLDKLRENGPFTLLAPTNEAFTKLAPDALRDLVKPENKSKLAEILNYHLIPDKFMAADIAKLKSAKTLQGQELKIETAESIKINGARLQARNVEASNGVIHAIDTVLVPSAARVV
jgi:uncharacterized surface protein with fasciclin (FAS1) repeats